MKLPRKFNSDFSLLKNNSLKLNYSSDLFVSCNNEEDLFLIHDFLKDNKLNYWIIGDGTNIILKNNLKGLVIKNNLKGISFYQNSMMAGAGELWDDIVTSSLDNNLYGLENLSGIPGSVGASPIQNIGAYGSELSDFIEYVETFNLKKGRYEVFSKSACNFSYRDSIFKKKPNLLITKICLNLSEKFKANTHYEALPKKVFDAKEQRKNILTIRSQKLPNHKKIPNVGSFFKNPIISESKLKKLILDFPEIKSYSFDEEKYKVSAAWLIDKLDLKGTTKGECGISKEHALVFYNFSDQSDSLLSYAKEVKKRIKENFDIALEFEPTIFS